MTERPTAVLLFYDNLKLLALGGVGLVLLLAGGLDGFGQTFAILMTVTSLGIVAFRIRRATQTPREDPMARPVITPPSTDQQIRILKRARLLLALSIIVLTAFITADLTSVERGAVTTTSTWFPIAILYDLLGYWPALLATPALGLLLWFLTGRKLARLEREGTVSTKGRG